MNFFTEHFFKCLLYYLDAGRTAQKEIAYLELRLAIANAQLRNMKLKLKKLKKKK